MRWTTPHDGYDQNFASLLSLLEPSLIIPGRNLKFDHYRRHMVRRLKRHVRMPDGSPKFVERMPVEPLSVKLPLAEEQLQAAVSEEAANLDLLAEKALRSDRESIRLVATILRKRAASSLAAIRKTVAQRRENISQTIADVEVRRDHLRAVRRGETISEEAQARLERDLYRSYLSAMQRTGRELRRLKDETDRLDQLEQLVAACGAGPEAKLLTLEGWLKALYEQHPEKKVIVFSEYTDTVDTIVTHLEGCGYSGQVVRLTCRVTGAPPAMIFTRSRIPACRSTSMMIFIPGVVTVSRARRFLAIRRLLGDNSALGRVASGALGSLALWAR
jgi:hypothetical protein